MNAINGNIPLSAERNEYSEILQHAVAVIEHARAEIAKHVNATVASAYWEIGKLLHERKIESGHGDNQRYAGHEAKVLRSVALLP